MTVTLQERGQNPHVLASFCLSLFIVEKVAIIKIMGKGGKHRVSRFNEAAQDGGR